jgi:hypothetical protein
MTTLKRRFNWSMGRAAIRFGYLMRMGSKGYLFRFRFPGLTKLLPISGGRCWQFLDHWYYLIDQVGSPLWNRAWWTWSRATCNDYRTLLLPSREMNFTSCMTAPSTKAGSRQLGT